VTASKFRNLQQITTFRGHHRSRRLKTKQAVGNKVHSIFKDLVSCSIVWITPVIDSITDFPSICETAELIISRCVLCGDSHKFLSSPNLSRTDINSQLFYVFFNTCNCMNPYNFFLDSKVTYGFLSFLNNIYFCNKVQIFYSLRKLFKMLISLCTEINSLFYPGKIIVHVV
jgi:hypothetical protein